MARETGKINKRRPDKNVALNSLREMLQNSCSPGRYGPFSRDTRHRSPSKSTTPPGSPEPLATSVTTPYKPTALETEFAENLKKNLEDLKSKVPEEPSDLALPTYREFIHHGIRYFMLPMDLLQFCFFRNESGVVLPLGSMRTELTTSEASPPHDSKYSPIPETSEAPRTPKPTSAPPPNTPTTPPMNRRSLDNSTHCSNGISTGKRAHRRWSPVPFVRMTLNLTDINLEKQPNLNVNLNLPEEPMEITQDDVPPKSPRPSLKPHFSRASQPNPDYSTLQPSPKLDLSDSSDYFPAGACNPNRSVDNCSMVNNRFVDYCSDSGSASDSVWSNRVSSVNSEIANVFAGCPTSSSEEETSDVECPRSSVSDLIREKHPASPRTPSNRRPLRKRDSPIVRNLPRPRTPPSPRDSAFSDPDSTSMVENMEQDFDYGADTEDSNDGIPMARRHLSFENRPDFGLERNYYRGIPGGYPGHTGEFPGYPVGSFQHHSAGGHLAQPAGGHLAQPAGGHLAQPAGGHLGHPAAGHIVHAGSTHPGYATSTPSIYAPHIRYSPSVDPRYPVGSHPGYPPGGRLGYASSSSTGYPHPRYSSQSWSPLNAHPGCAVSNPQYSNGHPGLTDQNERLQKLMEKERCDRWRETFNLDKSMLHLQIGKGSAFRPGFQGFTPAPTCYCGSPHIPMGAQPIQAPWNHQDLPILPHLYHQYPEFMPRASDGFVEDPSYEFPEFMGAHGLPGESAHYKAMLNYWRNYNVVNL